MALGTAAILGLGSVAGAVVQGRAASRAADAQADAANQANETERYIFDRSVELTEPQRVMGQNALAALGFEAGIAPLPTFGGTTTQAGNALSITETPGSEYRPVIQRNGDDPMMTTPATFAVGDRTFGTRDEAQAFINSQPMTGPTTTGGMQYTPIQFPDDPDTSLAAFEASPGYQFRLDEGMKAIERAAAARGMRFSGSAIKDVGRFGQGLASDEFGAFYGRTIDNYNRKYGEAMDSRNLLASLADVGQTATQAQIGAGNQYAAGTSANLTNMGNALAGGYMGRADAVTSGINNLSNIYGMGMSGYLGQNPGLGIKPLANPFGG